MKILVILFLIMFSIQGQTRAENIDQEIPHYKVYSRTPITDYSKEILDFYSVKEPYGEFSNFALFSITVKNIIWPSSEHYYQAQKFIDLELQEKVRLAPTPYLAAKIGRDPNLPMRDDWDEVKDDVMLIALKAKFSQYQVLTDLLLSTNDSHIFEHTKNDCYWGDCGDRTGLNRLGETLMQIRKELREKP
jgi:ribA/ribD-fused uncharacterized protein